MSDFQLVTGLSIMISGYTQLRCGLSVYHWRKIIQLAWFSSITHFCCLTFLRRYFIHHKRAQIWRIPAMCTLVILLTFALIPTARYSWYFDGSMSHEEVIRFVSEPAICKFFPKSSDLTSSSRAGIQRAGISITLLIVGMSVRLCRLYQASTDFCLSARRWCSRTSRSFLLQVHRRCKMNSPYAASITIFLYRPLLTGFLCLRILTDVTTAMAFEVSHVTDNKNMLLTPQGLVACS